MSEREYPVPDFPEYFVTYDGQVISYRPNSGRYGASKKPIVRKVLKGAKQVYGAGARFEFRHHLKHDERDRYARTGQVVAAAKYGRWPEPWEEVRHKDGNCLNNSMDNIELGDRINNTIDDYVAGIRTTSLEQLDLAIDKLMALREKMEQQKSPAE